MQNNFPLRNADKPSFQESLCRDGVLMKQLGRALPDIWFVHTVVCCAMPASLENGEPDYFYFSTLIFGNCCLPWVLAVPHISQSRHICRGTSTHRHL